MLRPSRARPRGLAFAVRLAAAGGTAGPADSRSVDGVRSGHVAWVYAQPDAASPHAPYPRSCAMRGRTTGCRELATGGWCHVTVRGTRGWVQGRILRASGGMMRG